MDKFLRLGLFSILICGVFSSFTVLSVSDIEEAVASVDGQEGVRVEGDAVLESIQDLPFQPASDENAAAVQDGVDPEVVPLVVAPMWGRNEPSTLTVKEIVDAVPEVVVFSGKDAVSSYAQIVNKLVQESVDTFSPYSLSHMVDKLVKGDVRNRYEGEACGNLIIQKCDPKNPKQVQINLAQLRQMEADVVRYLYKIDSLQRLILQSKMEEEQERYRSDLESRTQLRNELIQSIAEIRASMYAQCQNQEGVPSQYKKQAVEEASVQVDLAKDATGQVEEVKEVKLAEEVKSIKIVELKEVELT